MTPGAADKALLIMSEHWSCALVRAQLVDRGWRGSCAPTYGVALMLATQADAHPASVFLLEQDVLSSRERRAFALSGRVEAPPAFMLLVGATASAAEGPCDRLLRRPITLADVASAVEEELGAAGKAGAARHEHPAAPLAQAPYRARRGPPWPMIACEGCGASRHYGPASTAAAEAWVGAEQLKFVLEHAECSLLAGR